jgi:hypothetical protein
MDQGVFMSCKALFFIGLLTGFALSARTYGVADTESFNVTGALEKAGTWTVQRLKSELAADESCISYASHGQKHTANAFPLVALLKAAGVETDVKMARGADPKAKLPELRLVIVVQGRDGYSVTFSLAELLTAIGNRPVWLAIDIDGQPLSEGDGPVRIIVPEDQRPARWVHGVGAINVIDPTPPTTRPGN